MHGLTAKHTQRYHTQSSIKSNDMMQLYSRCGRDSLWSLVAHALWVSSYRQADRGSTLQARTPSPSVQQGVHRVDQSLFLLFLRFATPSLEVKT